MNTESKTLWTRVDGTKSKREAVLIGRVIDPNWLSGSVSLTKVHFVGDMKSAFVDCIEAARSQKLNLPIVSLRMTLLSRLENVISLDRHLGLKADLQGGTPAAIQMYSPPEENLSEVRDRLAQIVRRWIVDDVESWAERNNLSHLADRLRDTVSPSCFTLDPADTSYFDDKKRPVYGLIAREIGERLVGEELFEGMGPCELVASADGNSNTIELMTKPHRGEGRFRDDFYSLVARLSVASMPYSGQLYLSISAMKRVWAKRMPSLRFRASGIVTAYVMTSGRPVSRVSVHRTKEGWIFGDEYAALQLESGNLLPQTLADAINQREFNEETGWWAGLPELPSLFSSISPRTVFEGDEFALLETIAKLVAPLLISGNIPIREVKLPSLPAKPLQEMIRLTDFGSAGSVFSLSADEDEDEDAVEEDSALRKTSLGEYRNQNRLALNQVHGDKKPVIWLLSDYQTEKGLIRKTVDVLFGDSVTVYDEPLPPRTHGLRSDLDLPEGKARQRFDARVSCWETTAKQIRDKSGDSPIIVVICASDRVGNSPEDPVNYFAGIHALSCVGANIHHVLPIENPEEQSSQQNFLHRVQSALLDVLLAHSGAAFGVREFVDRLPLQDDGGNIPSGIYGVQAVRSRAQTRSGQTGVNFILFSRVLVESGHTQVRIGYRDGGNKLTSWMPLSKALSWMGSQRRLQEGDDDWLRAAFEPLAKEALIDIHTADPRAVIMIQWDSVRSLWRGISDADLNAGNPPRLGDLSLLRFEGATFIRLRNSSDTLSLRTLVRSAFRGWIDGAPSGEMYQENYVTTDKRLTEVSKSPDASENAYSHFIASMGYTKTVQVKRGLSCYRAMPRMSRIGQGSQEFELKPFDIASMDASLPAPMDLTVLTSPKGILPAAYAILAMGLRLGYAHHNDWTRLPMPLFFRTKIEDYVIRYPEDEDEAGIVLTGEREGTDTVGTPLSDKVVKAVEGIVDEEESPRPHVDEVFFKFDPKKGDATEDFDQLVSMVRDTDMPDIVSQLNDFNVRKLYHKMFNGEVNVNVELPYWLKTPGVLKLNREVTKRAVRRSWDRLHDVGYVRQHGDYMPSPAKYLDWLSSKLRVPQSSHAIVGATRDIGGLCFARLVDLIEEFNAIDPDALINPFSIENEEFEAMLAWACENRQDEFLGWLIFLAAQLPNPAWIKAIRANLSVMPGPRTEHALHYYLAVASTITSVLEQKGKSAKLNIYASLPDISIPPPKAEASGQVDLSEPIPADGHPALQVEEAIPDALPEPKDVIAGTVAVEESRQAVAIAKEITTDQESELIMTTKKTLVELIEAIAPGSSDFPAVLDSIQEQISVLEHAHQTRIARIRDDKERENMRNEFIGDLTEVAARINAIRDQLELPLVGAREVGLQDMGTAQAQMNEIEAMLNDIESLLRMLDELESSPKPTSLQERQRRREMMQSVEEEALSRGGELRHLLEIGICFVMDIPDTPDTPPEPTNTPASTPPEPTNTPASTPPVDETGSSPTPDAQSDVAGVESMAQPEMEPVQMAHEAVEPVQVVSTRIDETEPSESPASVATDTSVEFNKVEVRFEVLETAPGKEKVDAFVGNIVVLRQLFDQRLYGLADCQMAAFGALLKGSDNGELSAHQTILNALVQSMNAMDCEFSFENKLDPELSNLLTAAALPSGDVSDPEYLAMGILAAGIGNMLFDSVEVQWKIGNAVSARLSGLPGISSLVSHLDIIRQRSLMLTRDLFLRSRIGDKVAIENEITRLRKRADNWKDNQELHRNFHNYAFKAAHAHMFGESTAIGKCLQLIHKGDHARLEFAFEEARPKFKRPIQTIEESFKKVNERVRAEGTYRQMMIENIQSAEKFIATYLDLVRQKNTHVAELTRDVQSFLDGLSERLNEALREAQSMNPAKELEHLYRDAAVKAFRCVINLFDAGVPTACIPDVKQRLLLQLPLGKDLRPALDSPDPLTPPTCTPDEVFEQIRVRAGENIRLDDPNSESDIDRALADALPVYINKNCFLPAFLIASQAPSVRTPKGETIEHQYRKKRDLFSADLQDARQRVAHAMTLNALPTNEATRMQWLIEELLTLCQNSEHSISRPGVSSTAYPDFPQAYASLRCNVLQPLTNRLRESQDELERKLDSIAEKGVVSLTDVKRVREMVEGGNPATLMTAYDAMNMLEQNGKLPARLGATGNDLAEEYDAFIKRLRESTGRNRQLLDELVVRLSADPSEADPAWLAALNQEQRADAKEFIQSWLDFFKARAPQNAAINERLFQNMGFGAIPGYFPENGRTNRARFTLDKDTFRYLTTTTDDPLFVPPVLGSSATFNLCMALYGSPQETDVRQALAEVANVPTMILVRAQYEMQKRAKVSYSYPVLFVDDDLIAYAALHSGGRMANILKVSMLTFTTNPYDDYQTKPVPSEMFFGRQKELVDLHKVKGLAVLYGGRRLGKSSLLAQVELETNNRIGERAVYVSMLNADYSGDYVASAWEKLYETLVNRNLIAPITGTLPSQWLPIQQHIQRQILDSGKLKSLYLLIDEADDIMRRELARKKDEVSFVATLTQLTDSLAHACDVRIVIAGLHNMTRMADDVNSVFGKADPIALKPFAGVEEVQRGLRLITKPLAAMGYQFAAGSEDLAMRIMAVCNYYPAFIQLYCKHLVDQLQNCRQDKKPPFYITADDLSRVEKDNSLLAELRDKFALNLKLDKRYKAIALILADAYYTGVDKGIYTGMTTSDIREHCEAYCPTHFQNSGTGVYEALLDEMCKLNVIERSGAQYVLRNPNIAMMIGDRDRVTTLLSGLGSEPPETSRNQGERRVRMTLNTKELTFPMPMSWIRNHLNNTEDGQLVILTGNAASGLSDLARINRDEEWCLSGGLYLTAPVSQPSHLSQIVERERRPSTKTKLKKFLAILPNRWKVSEIPEYAAIAQKAGKYGLRILLLAPPERAFEITKAIESNALKMQPDVEKTWRVVSIPAWTEDAIHFHPAIHENIKVADQADALTAIRTATCGFNASVQKMCTSHLTLERALDAPNCPTDRLANSLSDFHQAIGMPPVLTEDKLKQIDEFLNLINSSVLSRSDFAELEECMATYGISEPMWNFLYWMGVIQEGPNNTWAVPGLYAKLLSSGV